MSYWDRVKEVRRARAVDVEDLAREASALLDHGGPTALTLRAVAERIGVAPASLYSRVDRVDDLLDLALDHTLAQDRTLDPAATHADHHELLLAFYRHLLRHPWAVWVIGLRPPRGPAYLRLSDRLCSLLLEDGVSDPLAMSYAMSNYVLGCAATARAAASELTVPPDPDVAPLYARLNAEHTLDPETVLAAGLRALRGLPDPDRR